MNFQDCFLGEGLGEYPHFGSMTNRLVNCFVKKLKLKRARTYEYGESVVSTW